MNHYRDDLIVWSEYVKVTKFARQLGVSKVAISNFIKHGTKTMSDDKIIELHNLISDTMRNYFA